MQKVSVERGEIGARVHPEVILSRVWDAWREMREIVRQKLGCEHETSSVGQLAYA